uniref:Disease resistance protein Roq1-like winged-helix domain-containing protein n=1 Tax=Salix viminalis TaxID=40686 RepID=A0A6N2MHR3_SALVM
MWIQARYSLILPVFFVGQDKDYVTDIVGARYGCHPEVAFRALIGRSLIAIDTENHNRLCMHDIVQRMGREIIRQRSPNHPEKCSRIVLSKDAYTVLSKEMGTDAVEAIPSALLNTKLPRTPSLERLILVECTSLVEGMQQLKESSRKHGQLKISSNSQQIAREFGDLESLTELVAQHTGIKQLLHQIDIAMPPASFTGFSSLKDLNLSYAGLSDAISSIDFGSLSFLVDLDLSGNGFFHLPSGISRLSKLQRFTEHAKVKSMKFSLLVGRYQNGSAIVEKDLHYHFICPQFQSGRKHSGYSVYVGGLAGLEESLQGVEELELNFKRALVSWLPHPDVPRVTHPSIQLRPVTSSQLLRRVTGCCRIKTLPKSICNSKSIETLNISLCSQLERLPEFLGDMEALTELLANGTAIKQLPASTGYLKKLTSCSTSIAMLPTPLTSLTSLKELDLSYCGLPGSSSSIHIGSLSSLEKLNLSGNKLSNLPSSIGHLLKLKDLWALGCLNLIEFRDMELLDTCSSILNFDGCNNLSNNYKKTLVQIRFPASEIPEWCSLRGEGSSFSFHFNYSLLGLDGYQLQGLLVRVVYAASLEGSFAPCRTILRNKNNSKVLFERPSSIKFDPSSTRNSWILSIPLIGGYGCAVKGVEELELNVEISSCEVEQCGVHLIKKQWGFKYWKVGRELTALLEQRQ